MIHGSTREYGLMLKYRTICRFDFCGYIMTVIEKTGNGEIKMGCCDKESCCESKKSFFQRLPWLMIVLGILVVLVLMYWQ